MSNSGTTAQTIEQILNEGETLAQSGVTSEVNFMPSVLRTIRDVERQSNSEAISDSVRYLQDDTINNPAAGHVLAMVLRHSPTRQSTYEAMLDETLPDWTVHLGDNPQTPLPDIFTGVGAITAEWNVGYSDGILEATSAMLQSTLQQNRVAALRACERIGARELAQACFDLFQNGPDDTRSRALLAAARLSDLSGDVQVQVINRFFDAHEDEFTRLCALEALLSTRPSDHLQSLKASEGEITSLVSGSPSFIEGLLDLALDSIEPTIVAALANYELSDLPETLLSRISRSQFLPMNLRQSSASILQQKTSIVPHSGQSKFGTVVHRDSSWTSAFVGHVGVSNDRDVNAG